MLAGFACAGIVLAWLAWNVRRCNRFINDAAGEE